MHGLAIVHKEKNMSDGAFQSPIQGSKTMTLLGAVTPICKGECQTKYCQTPYQHTHPPS